jgi:hypothetical protein
LNTTLLTRYLRTTEEGRKVLENLIEQPIYGIDEFGNEIVDGAEFFVDKLGLSIDDIVRYWGEGLIDLQDADKQRINQILADREAAARLLDETWKKATGTTRDSIADSIIQGFRDGKSSMQDFADTFEDLMKAAVLNSIKTQLLQGPILDFMKEFAGMAEDGLTESEVEKARGFFNDMFAKSKQIYDSITEIAGVDFFSETSKPEGLSGAIKGITEETAGLIAGQFFAFRELQQRVYEEIALKHTGILKQTMEYAGQSLETQNNHYQTAMQQLDVMNQSVTHLAAIEKNTVDIAKLNSIDDRLRDMNTYLKQIL